MNNILTWCEIPVTDIERAKAFYSNVFGVKFIDEEMEGMKMAMFETSSPTAASGALVKMEGYAPTTTGTVPYLWAGDNLEPALERAAKSGSEVVVPKTAIKDGAGFFSQFIDCEGNRIGLFSLA